MCRVASCVIFMICRFPDLKFWQQVQARTPNVKQDQVRKVKQKQGRSEAEAEAGAVHAESLPCILP